MNYIDLKNSAVVMPSNYIDSVLPFVIMVSPGSMSNGLIISIDILLPLCLTTSELFMTYCQARLDNINIRLILIFPFISTDIKKDQIKIPLCNEEVILERICPNSQDYIVFAEIDRIPKVENVESVPTDQSGIIYIM
jgi:hypothetical protein